MVVRHSKGARVLVADDDEGIRHAFRDALDDEGYDVSEAENGLTALAMLRASTEPMVVLLDLRMPGIDGGAVLGAVAADRQMLGRHAFILITADRATLTLPFVHLLTQLDVPLLRKPVDLDDLLAAVSHAAQRVAVS
jgi:CheY-like chemotaxis protein